MTRILVIIIAISGLSACGLNEPGAGPIYTQEEQCENLDTSDHSKQGRNRVEICRIKRERDAKKQEAVVAK